MYYGAMRLCVICVSCCVSREHEGADLRSIPTGVLVAALQSTQLPEAGLVDESLLLALPQEIFILFGQRTQVHVLAGMLVNDVLGVHLHGLAVSEKTRPQGRPVWVEHLLLRNICTL